MFRPPLYNSGEGRNVASEHGEMAKMGFAPPKPHKVQAVTRRPKPDKIRKLGSRR